MFRKPAKHVPIEEMRAIALVERHASTAFERRVHRLKGLPEDLLTAIEAAKMDASHDHLNALLEGE